nr:hypothetical protein [Priestia megaterium]
MWKTEWTKWSTHKELPSELKKQMTNMTETEREDAFYKQLEFGTGGMRGELGAGSNCMNIYTIRKVTAGLAKYIEESGKEVKKRGVVIAYDYRHGSAEFALEAAKTLGSHGIKSYVFQELRPTPELSFVVRYLRAYAGIMITASHNPSEYNGYKVYGEDGAQLPPTAANVIVTHMNKIENELLLEVKDERELLKQNLVSYIGENLDQVYLDRLCKRPSAKQQCGKNEPAYCLYAASRYGTNANTASTSKRRVSAHHNCGGAKKSRS